MRGLQTTLEEQQQANNISEATTMDNILYSWINNNG